MFNLVSSQILVTPIFILSFNITYTVKLVLDTRDHIHSI